MPFFTPPTHEESMQTNVRPLCYFRETWANSVVRINGVFTSVRSPNGDLLTPNGEGIDWFIGGHEYQISDETAAELISDGFTVTGVGEDGYGIGPYGLGGYGL